MIITDIDFKKEAKKNDNKAAEITVTVDVAALVEELAEKVEQMDEEDEELEDMDEEVDAIIGQISVLTDDLITTNATLRHFFKNKKISAINDFYVKDNLMVVFQKDGVAIPRENPEVIYYATSFEEALILKNYDNELLLDILKKVIKKEVLNILGDANDACNIAHNSRDLQKLLTRKKSSFSNSLIFSLVTINQNKPELPDYILKGFEWLTLKLKREGVAYEL
ncbi:hypothetical protein V5036_15865 [Enterobacter cloacae]|uniref:hypothetical protein n=1 Tax=Enterobacter cloacae TaxID=550 RepID=UPI0030767F3D